MVQARAILVDFLRQGRGLLDKQAAERNSGEDAGDGFSGGSVAVGVLHAAQGFSELRIEGLAEGAEDCGGFSRRVDHVAGALAALLAQAHVDGGQGEGGGFHDAGGRVADERVHLAEEAPVSNGVEVDEDMGVRAGFRQRLRALDERVASGVGVGVDEEKLAGGLGERGEERIGFNGRVFEDGDRMIRG